MKNIHRLYDAKNFLDQYIKENIEFAIILDAGFEITSNHIKAETILPYALIPGFPVATTDGKAGEFIIGTMGEKSVIVFSESFHFYEGYPMEDVVFPVRLMRLFGVKNLILANRAEGLTHFIQPGDVMMVTDHINLMYENPLIGPNYNQWGSRFPDLTNTYNNGLTKKAIDFCLENDIILKEGVYCALQGPNLPTAAETNMLRILGCDAFGMSTIPEILAGVHLGMDVSVFSLIVDKYSCPNNSVNFKAIRWSWYKLLTIINGLIS